MVLNEYKDILGKMAGSIGILHLVIPAGICLQIIRQGSTENVNAAHFMMGGCITLMKVRHGQLLQSSHMVTSAATGFTLCMVYLSVYLFYCDEKLNLAKNFAKFMMIPIALISYTYVDDVTRAEYVYSLAVSGLMFCLMAFPVMQMRKVIRQKHTGDMSLAMALLGTIQSTLWFLYALTLGNYIEILSRLLFVIMLAPQLVLFCIYPMPKTTSKRKEEAKSK